MSADRSGSYRVVVGDQGELFSGHALEGAECSATVHEVSRPVTRVHGARVQVSKRALKLAYRGEKQIALAFDLGCSPTVAQRLMDTASPRPVSVERIDRLPPLKRALVRSFEELIELGADDADAVRAVRRTG